MLGISGGWVSRTSTSGTPCNRINNTISLRIPTLARRQTWSKFWESSSQSRKMSKLHMPSVAYSATSLAAAMMNSVFMFYYVKVFLNRYNISQWWFEVAQIIFMIWNAINDPLFGYWQDNATWTCVKSRRHSILYGAPFFALSFLGPWFPWGSYGKDSIMCGIHLITALCIYDALFTFVLLAQCALFTEMSKRHEDRLRLVKYSQVGSLIGSMSVFICDMASNNLENFLTFQGVCIAIAIIAYVCMTYTGKNANTIYDIQLLGAVEESDSSTRIKDSSGEMLRDSESDSMWSLTLQIIRDRNFICFVLMNFCQVFHTTFNANFISILVDNLIPKEQLPSAMRSSFYAVLMIFPQLIVIFGASLVSSVGSYKIIRMNFILKIIIGLMVYAVGIIHPVFLLIFFLIDSGLSSATFSLFNISLSDIIDDDVEKYGRRHPLSSMIFGTNALITKPAQSFAPMIAVAILNQFGYNALKEGTLNSGSGLQELHAAMFAMATILPVILGAVQLLVWSQYSLRSSHKAIPKYIET
ncbi:unnamed protein product [Owenia fusiformis]|uniref:Uncharacterized protein n=1 Tax=Owenia fusiformis TaxID=6347 RepID=A0A8J1U954_OWEFU|nr:unnamed protein product [Owenia fusiformis]